MYQYLLIQCRINERVQMSEGVLFFNFTTCMCVYGWVSIIIILLNSTYMYMYISKATMFIMKFVFILLSVYVHKLVCTMLSKQDVLSGVCVYYTGVFMMSL